MKTNIFKTKGDWTEVLNDCRTTVSKDWLQKEPTESFKKRILISEHSPIRDISFKWVWENIPSFCMGHFVRHKWEKFVTTRREDRHGVPRNELTQTEPVSMVGEANIQHLIDTARKRLCFQSDPTTRGYMEDLKMKIKNEDKYIADVLVPNCIYRCGCPEQMGEKCEYFAKLIAANENIKSTDIQTRYDAYNEMFYKTHKVEE